jgi:hypothetical protein
MADMEHSGKPKIAGVLLIISGSIGILGALIGALILWAFSEGVAVGFGDPGNAPLSLLLVLGIIVALPGLIAVIGGISALKRRRWGLTLAGSIGAMLYFTALGIPALVLLILSKKEFESRRSEFMPND